MSTEDGLVKIRIELEEEDGDAAMAECVWAKKVGDDRYEVRNIPVFTEEINFGDVVHAVAPNEESYPLFIEIARRGGHRTIFIEFTDKGLAHKEEVLVHLRAFGVGREHAFGELHVINVPPRINFDEVVDYLEDCEDKGWLEHSYAPQPQPKGIDELIH